MDQRRSLYFWIKTTVNKFAISNHTALILRVCVCMCVCKTTSRSDCALSAIFSIIVYCCLLDTETLVMLRIVCIHGNANYSQSEILHFQFFCGGACPQTLYGTRSLFPHCMPVKFLGHADLPFFIPAELTALHTVLQSIHRLSSCYNNNNNNNIIQCTLN